MGVRGSIEELVRAVLGVAEIDPSPGSWNAIQRKVRWRQFTRFDPGRFNIFYASGLVVAGAGIIALLNQDVAADRAPLLAAQTETGATQPGTGRETVAQLNNGRETDIQPGTRPETGATQPGTGRETAIQPGTGPEAGAIRGSRTLPGAHSFVQNAQAATPGQSATPEQTALPEQTATPGQSAIPGQSPTPGPAMTGGQINEPAAPGGQHGLQDNSFGPTEPKKGGAGGETGTVTDLDPAGTQEAGGDQDPAGPQEAGGENREVIPSPQGSMMVFFTPSVISGCVPLEVTFFNCSVHATGARWDFGTGETSRDLNPDYTFHEPGTYTVTLTSEDGGGSPAAFRQVIEVYPAPQAEFEIEEGLQTPGGVEEFNLLNYSSGAVRYRWDAPVDHNEPGNWSAASIQPVVRTRELDPGAKRIRLVATSAYGCTDTLIRAMPETSGSEARALRFPNAFSPNATGPSGGDYSPHEKRNDVFHPGFSNTPAKYRLRVYSRRGELVFESDDIYTGWDGYYLQERAAGGVYVWMAEGSWFNGEEFSLQGDVTLIWGDRR